MNIVKKIKQELINIVPAIIYFAISFNLIYFTMGLMLRPGEIRYFSLLFVNLGALVAAKILIIANALPFINAFPDKPLIYNILWKFFIYTVCIYLCWVIEAVIHLEGKYKNIIYVWHHLIHEMKSPIFWATLLILMSVFFIFVIASEFIRTIGKDKIVKILFKPNPLI